MRTAHLTTRRKLTNATDEDAHLFIRSEEPGPSIVVEGKPAASPTDHVSDHYPLRIMTRGEGYGWQSIGRLPAAPTWNRSASWYAGVDDSIAKIDHPELFATLSRWQLNRWILRFSHDLNDQAVWGLCERLAEISGSGVDPNARGCLAIGGLSVRDHSLWALGAFSSSLVCLHLRACAVTDQGIANLCRQKPKLTALSCIELTGLQGITPKGLRCLAQATFPLTHVYVRQPSEAILASRDEIQGWFGPGVFRLG